MQKAKRSGNGGVVVVGGGGPPCGACKFLRRKCVRGCVFAPYFDSEQGAAHFAAVHKVFGASNASKLLLRLPPHRRVDAVVALCYEAFARVRDPVYGCVAHIFTLQQQVLKLQTDLAYVQARLSTFQALIPSPASARISQHSLPAHSSEMVSVLDSNASSADPNLAAIFDPVELLHQSPGEITGFSDPMCDTQQLADAQLQAIAREFVSQCLPGVKIGSLASPKSPWK